MSVSLSVAPAWGRACAVLQGGCGYAVPECIRGRGEGRSRPSPGAGVVPRPHMRWLCAALCRWQDTGRGQTGRSALRVRRQDQSDIDGSRGLARPDPWHTVISLPLGGGLGRSCRLCSKPFRASAAPGQAGSHLFYGLSRNVWPRQEMEPTFVPLFL